MAATSRVVILLLGLIIVCSAAVTRNHKADSVGPFNKAVLIGRALAAQKRGFYNNNCNLEKCWDTFYADAFTSVGSCNTAMEDLKTCVSSGVTSEELCTCNFHQVEIGLANIDDKMCATLHNTNWGRCADAKAQACAEKMGSLNQKMQSRVDVSVAQKKTLYTEVHDCLEEVIEDGLSTAGCEYMFPKGEGDLDYAVNMLAVQGWSEGCEEISHIAALCPSPQTESVEHCSDENDIVDNFVECAKKELTSKVCQSFLSDAASMLNKVKKAACTKIHQIQKTIDETCGEEGRKRILLKRLLKLLHARK